ncbi:hypothetical protein J1N35_012503 [Gossypium stocksii]|uniref:Large ribosomal subunit protein uL18 C-terminal eukaryotes domain-containing protein n=1 Tax=Gossypium stocksii TaxID=47602 RepID=A0A9D4AEF6_9ROSI|nr:hypothetical protein J1N35_012503 [Gossypium stocksii]
MSKASNEVLERRGGILALKQMIANWYIGRVVNVRLTNTKGFAEFRYCKLVYFLSAWNCSKVPYWNWIGSLLQPDCFMTLWKSSSNPNIVQAEHLKGKSIMISKLLKMAEEMFYSVVIVYRCKYIKRGIEADNIQSLYKKVHAAIRADPTAKKTEKEPPKQHKRLNLKKLTYEERKSKLIERLHTLNAAAGADSEEDD